MVNHFLKALDTHEKSKHHLQCLLAKRAVDNPSSGPLNIWEKRGDRERRQQIQKRINAAYHIIKSEQPFVAFEKTVALLKKNRVDVGS